MCKYFNALGKVETFVTASPNATQKKKKKKNKGEKHLNSSPRKPT